MVLISAARSSSSSPGCLTAKKSRQSGLGECNTGRVSRARAQGGLGKLEVLLTAGHGWDGRLGAVRH